MNIFKDGYLDLRFLNPEYRGISGFPAEWFIGIHVEPSDWHNSSVLTIRDGKYVSNGYDTIKFHNDDDMELLRIPKFASNDIPLDEYCWVNYGGEWKLETRLEFVTTYDEIVHKHEIDEPLYCVPTLIAETRFEAEKLKEWDESNYNTIYIRNPMRTPGKLIYYSDGHTLRHEILSILNDNDSVTIVFDFNIENVSISFITGLTEGIPKQCITFKGNDKVLSKLDWILNGTIF